MPEDELRDFLSKNKAVAADWDDTYGDRMQLVFIGRNMDRKAIVEGLEKCVSEE